MENINGELKAQVQNMKTQIDKFVVKLRELAERGNYLDCELLIEVENFEEIQNGAYTALGLEDIQSHKKIFS